MQPKIKNLFIYFLPWRCGYSRIAQTQTQRTKTFGLYSNSRAFFNIYHILYLKSFRLNTTNPFAKTPQILSFLLYINLFLWYNSTKELLL